MGRRQSETCLPIAAVGAFIGAVYSDAHVGGILLGAVLGAGLYAFFSYVNNTVPPPLD